MDRGEIIIYQTPDGFANLDIRLENETIWLTQSQMAALFGTERPAITKHVNNIYKSGELEEVGTCSILEHMVIGVNRFYHTKFYSLDVVLSVGYRVNSQKATQFRIWANRVLKEYIIQGYVINQQAKAEQLENLKHTVKLLSNVLNAKLLSVDEATGLLKVVTDYAYALDTLDKYDYQSLEIGETTIEAPFRATYENAMEAIVTLRQKFGGCRWFGNEKDKSFHSSINAIYQTFGGKDLYPSIEEKAAMLLYFVVKNHSFTDGNKRIAAFLFLWFLEKNGILYKADGSRLIENNTLIALTLMIALSQVEEMDILVKVVINLINRNN